MSIKYNLVKRTDPSTRTEMYGPSVKYTDKVSLEEIARVVSKLNSTTEADVIGIFRAFAEIADIYITQSYSIQFGKLGKLKATMSTEQVENPLDYNKSCIRKLNLRFMLSKEFKNKLKSTKCVKTK